MRWSYDNCIPFNILSFSFASKAIDAIAIIGPVYTLQSYYILRVNLLRDCIEECKLLLTHAIKDIKKYVAH